MEERALLEEFLNCISIDNINQYINQQLDGIKKYKYVCLFGISVFTKDLIDYLKVNQIKVDYICDDDIKKQGKIYNDFNVSNIEKLYKAHKDSLAVVVNSGFYNKEITDRCKKIGIKEVFQISARFYENYLVANRLKFIENKEKVLEVYDLLEDIRSKQTYACAVKAKVLCDNRYVIGVRSGNTQYFDKEIIELEDKEVFVDIGSFDGQDSVNFAKECNNRQEKIYMFEINKNNCDLIIKKVEGKVSRCVIENKGIYKENCVLPISDDTSNSKICDNASNLVQFIKMDDYIKSNRVTFIKMDIEGAEFDALLGCMETIKKQKPKIAICIYHKSEDFWRIPCLIKELNKDYKFFVRHYSSSEVETVLYAI